MTKVLIFLIIISFSILNSSFIIQPVYAHFLETDGNIGAVLHISPNDSPEAFSESNFFFDIKDKTDKFNLQNCECFFIVSKSGKEIYRSELDKNSSSVSFTFPEIGIYKITLSGKDSNRSFQKFTLDYDVRIEKEKASNENNTSNNWVDNNRVFIFGIVLIIAILGVTLVTQKLGKDKL